MEAVRLSELISCILKSRYDNNDNNLIWDVDDTCECGSKQGYHDTTKGEVFCSNCGLIIQDALTAGSIQNQIPYFNKPIRLKWWFSTPESDLSKRFSDPQYEKWRNKVIKKYQNKCVKCGDEGKHCHHIKNYSQYPKLRFDPNNGILFCIKCHNKFHNIFGVTNNNQKQITKFLRMNLEAVD